MTISPKKYSSTYTSCAVHRGVEAKHTKPANAQGAILDVTTSTSQLCAESSEEREPPSAAPPPQRCAEPAPDDSASYLQVVVEKRRRARRSVAAHAQTSPRLPSASSPQPRVAERGVYVLSHPVLLACSAAAASPLCKALHNYSGGGLAVAGASGGGACSVGLGAGAGDGDAARDAALTALPREARKKNKAWKIFGNVSDEDLYDNEPERVELYYFEQSAGAFLATADAGRDTWSERAARRPARAARALLSEFLAAPAMLAHAPLAVLLAAQRQVLLLTRAAVTGCVQTASDYALKPALALAFNALLQPLLVFAANAARGVRAVLQPLAGALSDAVEPAVRLLGVARLVEVRLACPHCQHL